MKNEAIKTDVAGWVKDPKTNALINNNIEEFEQYKAQRNKVKEMAEVKNTISGLERDIAEIKQLLVQALKGN